jgi:hypothetical protein
VFRGGRWGTLARNSFLGAFLDGEEKAVHLARLDAYVAGEQSGR